jgi:hypothetical protein
VKTHGVKALINDPMTRVIWVWENTREEIPKVQEMVRGELPTAP